MQQLLLLFLCIPYICVAQSSDVKALVGDRLIDGFGIDPMYSIRAATYWPSVAMDVDDKVGTITEGKYADIIAVKGDVLRRINILQTVDFVMKRGSVVKVTCHEIP